MTEALWRVAGRDEDGARVPLDFIPAHERRAKARRRRRRWVVLIPPTPLPPPTPKIVSVRVLPPERKALKA